MGNVVFMLEIFLGVMQPIRQVTVFQVILTVCRLHQLPPPQEMFIRHVFKNVPRVKDSANVCMTMNLVYNVQQHRAVRIKFYVLPFLGVKMVPSF